MISMPTFITLSRARARRELIEALAATRNFVLAGHHVVLDFSGTRKVYSDGTILLLAEVDRLRTAVPSTRIHGTRPGNRIAAQAFDHVGLSKLLSIARPPAKRRSSLDSSVKHWRFATGSTTEMSTIEPLARYLNDRAHSPTARAIYRGISEAMTNTVFHAYTDARGDGISSEASVGKRWWMFFQVVDNTLSISFCDLGIGIHRSLRSSQEWMAKLLSAPAEFFASAPQAHEIKFAIDTQRTRTHEGHRGKGLLDVRRVIEDARAGHLCVTSCAGEYKFWFDSSGSEQEAMTDLDAVLMGTIVTWSLPLGASPSKAINAQPGN